jgi:hypothetical protein
MSLACDEVTNASCQVGSPAPVGPTAGLNHRSHERDPRFEAPPSILAGAKS